MTAGKRFSRLACSFARENGGKQGRDHRNYQHVLMNCCKKNIYIYSESIKPTLLCFLRQWLTTCPKRRQCGILHVRMLFQMRWIPRNCTVYVQRIRTHTSKRSVYSIAKRFRSVLSNPLVFFEQRFAAEFDTTAGDLWVMTFLNKARMTSGGLCLTGWPLESVFIIRCVEC